MEISLFKRNSKTTINAGYKETKLEDTAFRTLLSITETGTTVEYVADWLRGGSDPMVSDVWTTWETFELKFELKNEVYRQRAELIRLFASSSVVALADNVREIVTTGTLRREFHLSQVQALDWINFNTAIFIVEIRAGRPFNEWNTSYNSTAKIELPHLHVNSLSYRLRAKFANTGDVTVTINGAQFKMIGVGTNATIEINTFDALAGVGAIGGTARGVPRETSRADFLPLLPGVNIIQFGGLTASSADVLFRSYEY